MATCYITEFGFMAKDRMGSAVLAGVLPAVAEQTVAVGAEAKSAAFQTGTRFIRVNTDAVCSIKGGPSATTTATTASMRLDAGATEYFSVQPGDVLSVIANT